jgi:pilus assembly protein Flp/PilA
MNTEFHQLCVKLQILLDEDGQDLIEYALLVALIAVGAVVTMQGLGATINNAFSTIGTTLSNSL